MPRQARQGIDREEIQKAPEEHVHAMEGKMLADLRGVVGDER